MKTLTLTSASWSLISFIAPLPELQTGECSGPDTEVEVLVSEVAEPGHQVSTLVNNILNNTHPWQP